MKVLLVILLLAMPFYIGWYYARMKSMLAAWATANRLTILETHRGFFPPLRMLLTTSREQALLHVKVYDESTHRIRNGWVRLGSYWSGLLDADAIEVRWEDE
ncbi:MAG TPA: hypothetical protein VGG00_07715 [Rhodanobacter sp.]|jgi:lipopolysaccharide biosynthesis regulator YciM